MSRGRQATEYLGQVPLFAQLTRGQLRKLARHCIPRSYAEGTLIIEEGSVGLGLFLITAGRVEIFKGHGDGRVDLATLEAGGIVGELSVIDDTERSANVRTVTDTECLLLTRDSFQTLLRQDPEIVWCLVPVLAQRVRALQVRVLSEQQSTATGDHPAPAKAASETSSVAAADAAASDALVKLARAQYAGVMAGVTGLEEAARVSTAFLRRLARETELDSAARSGSLLRRLPEGLLAASGEAWTEGEKLPEKVVASFLRHLKRDAQ